MFGFSGSLDVVCADLRFVSVSLVLFLILVCQHDI